MALTEQHIVAKNFQENMMNRWKFLEELPASGRIGFLLDSPVPVITFTLSYILFVVVIGPLFMRNREPYNLKKVIRLYNLLMVFLAGMLLYKLYDAVDSLDAMMDCSKIFSFSDASAVKIYRMSNFILAVRLSEYLDTIFFTLRKKTSQITFLHVFHHSYVPIYAYWILRTAPVRFNVYIILINSAIHVLMYSYYFLATFQERRDPTKKAQKQGFLMTVVNKLLLFKKYMTQLQILQFVSLAFYAAWFLLQKNNCGVPATYIWSNLLMALGFLGLFMHFYIAAYKAASKPSRRQS